MIDSIKIYDKSTEKSIILDKFSAMFLLDDEGIDWGTVTPTISSYPSIYGLGSQVSNITFQKARNITIIGWIINDNTGTISQKRKILNTLVNPMNEIRIFAGKYYIDGIFSSSVKYTNKHKENNDTVCKFQISISCFDPFFRLISPVTYRNLEPTERTETMYEWEFTINNTSGIPYGFELYLTLDEDAITNQITITNATTRKHVTAISEPPNVYRNEILYLNTIKGHFSFGATETIPITTPPEDFNDLHMDSSFEFLQIVPGKNEIHVVFFDMQETVPGCFLDVFFNPLFLTCEEV